MEETEVEGWLTLNNNFIGYYKGKKVFKKLKKVAGQQNIWSHQ